MPDVPLALPDHAPFGSVFPSFLPVPLVIITHPTLEPVWRHFKAKLIAHSKDSSHRDSQRKKTVRLRAECVRSSYEACRPDLALALCMPVGALPTWDHMKEAPEVEVLCWMPLMFLQEKPSAEFQQIFERAVEADRLIAVRHALAAQLDISVEESSCGPDDYPATTYDKSFLDRVINRFEVGQSDYLTYHEALATGHSAEAVSQMTRPAWRRAIAHVLRAAEIEDTECSLDKLDALGAGFRWKNAPPGYKGRAYSWRRMVSVTPVCPASIVSSSFSAQPCRSNCSCGEDRRASTSPISRTFSWSTSAPRLLTSWTRTPLAPRRISPLPKKRRRPALAPAVS